MKRKNIIITLISILAIISIISISFNSNNKQEYLQQSNVKYAILLDGKKTNGFPSQGLYDVNVSCKNASGNWDYSNWKLNIKEISGDVECNISFTSIPKTYFNEKIITLSETTQGNGKVIYEKMTSSPVNINWTSLSQENYGSIFEANSASYTTGTTKEAFSFDGAWWSSVTANMTSGKYYHINFTIPEDGYYEVCYNIPATNTSNEFYVYKGSTRIGTTVTASSSTSKNDCLDIGHTTANTTYRIIQKAYSSSSASIPVMKFQVKKSDKVTNYRYQGKNPNNYVLFNDELWRVIGVFGSESHAQTNKDLVKIIRNESIGGLTWDKSNGNAWGSSSLKNLLNNYYYLHKNGTSSGYCYSYTNTITTNCNYTATGIQDKYAQMVADAAWYLGTYTGVLNNASAPVIYNSERSGTAYKSKIGLMYISDYSFSMLENNCARTTNIGEYYKACDSYSWMRGAAGPEWTISTYDTKEAFVFFGISSHKPTNESYAVRPTLYLDESVYVLHGDGSITNPYIIQMD